MQIQCNFDNSQAALTRHSKRFRVGAFKHFRNISNGQLHKFLFGSESIWCFTEFFLVDWIGQHSSTLAQLLLNWRMFTSRPDWLCFSVDELFGEINQEHASLDSRTANDDERSQLHRHSNAEACCIQRQISQSETSLSDMSLRRYRQPLRPEKGTCTARRRDAGTGKVGDCESRTTAGEFQDWLPCHSINVKVSAQSD